MREFPGHDGVGTKRWLLAPVRAGAVRPTSGPSAWPPVGAGKRVEN